MVSFRGKVIEKKLLKQQKIYDKLFKRYLRREKYPYRTPNEIRIIIKIKPERIDSFTNYYYR